MNPIPDPEKLLTIAKHAGQPVTLETDVFSLFVACSHIQVSMRHPRVPSDIRAAGKRFVESVAESFNTIDPALGAALLDGFDPQKDAHE